MKSLTDEQLMAMLQDGDDDALSQLIDRYEGPVFAFCCSFCKWDSVIANELMQDVFVRLYEQRSMYNRDKPFRPWLYRLARNQIINNLKRIQRETKRSAPIPLDLASLDKGPESLVLKQEEVGNLEELMKDISAQQQEIVHLLRQGLSYKEIAGVLDFSEAVVRNNLMRAVRKMRDIRYKSQE